jgi:hypothetical protein
MMSCKKLSRSEGKRKEPELGNEEEGMGEGGGCAG